MELKQGVRVRVARLEEPNWGSSVSEKTLKLRAVNKVGTIKNEVFKGVWWVLHDGTTDEFGLYYATELEPA